MEGIGCNINGLAVYSKLEDSLRFICGRIVGFPP